MPLPRPERAASRPAIPAARYKSRPVYAKSVRKRGSGTSSSCSTMPIANESTSDLGRSGDARAIAECVADAVVHGERADQTGDGQQPENRPFAHDQANRAAAFGSAAMRTDQRAEAGRVQELDLREIDDDVLV